MSGYLSNGNPRNQEIFQGIIWDQRRCTDRVRLLLNFEVVASATNPISRDPRRRMAEKNMANFLHESGGLATWTVLLVEDDQVGAVTQILRRPSRPTIGNVKPGTGGFRQPYQISQVHYPDVYGSGQRERVQL